ncbi:MAG: squalene--hopene cyclase [Planctomycetota bacterium]|nr:MAG: squalene--hopene cyclase [Planctomycetota bacterium]
MSASFREAAVSAGQVRRAYEVVRAALLAEIGPDGHWTGELSSSALSTATAVMAFTQCRRFARQPERFAAEYPMLERLTEGGLRWLAEHQNPDGGWGDTVLSLSNISTTMLGHAVFHAAGAADRFSATVDAAARYIERAGGVSAVLARYGRDRTFSIPILTHCALAGTVDWRHVLPLPFELACLPARFYKTVRLPVVSYALPALIAIGQVVHRHRPTPFLPLRWLRNAAIEPSLRILERIQPPNGGFLEATPLTSFVTMSLAACGRVEHPVVQRGLAFLVASVRSDGSWPIDTNLATWVTTLAVNALGEDLPQAHCRPLLHWLLAQQYRHVHPYTNAAPGGWAWTDLPGGVPDADDTPGAILAVIELAERLVRGGDADAAGEVHAARNAVRDGIRWLLDLQNRDGGWPTFCRGWGRLPFDRSAADLTAHAIRALRRWRDWDGEADTRLRNRADRAVERGFRYLARTQRPDGCWLPLWFGNQYAATEDNPTYGTARVLMAYAACGRWDDPACRRGVIGLLGLQNAGGGFGAGPDTPDSVEETALAVEALATVRSRSPDLQRAVQFLIGCVEDGRFRHPAPIGFYFAKLWYFERLYPLIFSAAALRRAALLADNG